MNPQDAPKAPEWLPVAEVAARLGVSVRAVQKRCANGTLPARRVSVAGREVWEVDGHELGREPDANPANLKGQTDANANQEGREPGYNHAQNGVDLDANTNRTGREQDAKERELRDLLERERELNGFLRGLIEQRDRDAAELRAALREALKATPKQLKAAPVEATQEAPAKEPQTISEREPRPLWKLILGIRR